MAVGSSRELYIAVFISPFVHKSPWCRYVCAADARARLTRRSVSRRPPLSAPKCTVIPRTHSTHRESSLSFSVLSFLPVSTSDPQDLQLLVEADGHPIRLGLDHCSWLTSDSA